MESITFTCTANTEEIEKIANWKEKVARFCFLSLLVLYSVILYMLWPEGGIHDTFMLVLFLFIIASMLFLLFMIRHSWQKFRHTYALMATKEFGWDETSSQFFYRDDERTLRFKSSDVKKWYSLEDDNYDESAEINFGETTDIIHLHTGEKIVLERLWNRDIHKYLRTHYLLFGLPEPKRRSF